MTADELAWPVTPMKAVAGPLPSGDRWTFEPKWDGHRAIVRTGGDHVEATSSTGRPRGSVWPWLAPALFGRCPPGVVLDGEVIALDDAGRPAFSSVGDPDAVHSFVVFDVLAELGHSIVDQPWQQRRALLETLVEPGPQLAITPTTPDGTALWELTRQGGYEGVVAKRTDARYVPGQRSRAWVKTKHRFEQELVVGGFTEGTGHRHALGALLLGVHDAEGELRFAGGVGSGLSAGQVHEWRTLLDERLVEHSPFVPDPGLPRRRARWVRPELVVQVAFTGWTPDGRLRHPVALGRRDDVDPSTVRREAGPET